MVQIETSYMSFAALTSLKLFNPNLVFFLVQFHSFFHSFSFEDQILIVHTLFNLFT